MGASENAGFAAKVQRTVVNKRFSYRRGIEHVTANSVKNPNCNGYIAIGE